VSVSSSSLDVNSLSPFSFSGEATVQVVGWFLNSASSDPHQSLISVSRLFYIPAFWVQDFRGAPVGVYGV
jgi:hypothetical protein